MDVVTQGIPTPNYPPTLRECAPLARRLILEQLSRPMSLYRDQVLNKLGGFHPDFKRGTCANHELGPLLDDIHGIDMLPIQFLHWHAQHQSAPSTDRKFAGHRRHGIPTKTIVRVFINMLREKSLNIIVRESRLGGSIKMPLRLIDGHMHDRPGKSLRIVRAFLDERSAEKALAAIPKYARPSSRTHDIGSESMCDLMNRLLPGWEQDEEFLVCVGVSHATFRGYISDGVIPQGTTARAIAEYLNIEVDDVLMACNKTKEELGISRKMTLRAWRELAGVTVKELSMKSKVSVPSIVKYELGETPRVKSGIKDRLAKALGVRVRNITWGVGPQAASNAVA